jgi:hypothetical protein
MVESLAVDVAAEFASLGESYDVIEALLAGDREALARVAPSVSGWAAEQHLAHVALANELCCRNLASLARGSGPFVQDSGEPIPAALEILRSGAIPRGAAQSPRIVRPPPRVQRELLLEWVAGNRRDFAAAALDPAALERATGRVPHQLLGPLTAPLWLRFAAVHTRHHLAIAREVIAST